MNTANAETTSTLRLERLPQVRSRTGLGRTEIYRRVALGEFPAPIKIGERASAWDSREIDKWIISKLAARDARMAA